MSNRDMKRVSILLINRKCKSYHRDITSHLLEWPLLKRREIRGVGEMLEKRESSYTAHGKVN